MRWTSNTFRLSNAVRTSCRKNRVFRQDAPIGLLDRKTGIEKALFNSMIEPDFVSDRKPSFSTNVSDCKRTGLRAGCSLIKN